MKRFPCTNNPGASSGWKENHIRKIPAELLRKLIQDRLFAFDSVRFFQSRNVKPAFLLQLTHHEIAGRGDETIHHSNIGAVRFAFFRKNRRSIFWHEDMTPHSAARSI